MQVSGKERAPARYPHPVQRVEVIETHISCVPLTQDETATAVVIDTGQGAWPQEHAMQQLAQADAVVTDLAREAPDARTGQTSSVAQWGRIAPGLRYPKQSAAGVQQAPLRQQQRFG